MSMGMDSAFLTPTNGGDDGKGTVTDTQTKLMWTKNANLHGFQPWNDAVAVCSAANEGGFSDWRLPNEEELSALAVAIQGEHPFENLFLHSPYWTGTENPENPSEASIINSGIGSGAFALKVYPFFVWPVRNSS